MQDQTPYIPQNKISIVIAESLKLWSFEFISELCTILCFLLCLSCSNDKLSSNSVRSTNFYPSKYDSFFLRFQESGLGSNFGKLCPNFELSGRDFTFILEQNSFYTERTLESEFISSGLVRPNSLDSIIEILSSIDDTLIYRTNTSVMSGSLQSLFVRFENKEIMFSLHNAGDSNAQKIIDILNTNLPKDTRKLWIWDFPEKY